jgi:D-cysteine desulfhydrase
VPLGGSSWLGTVGFVNAGLELAAQIESGGCPRPARIYIALGTMGSAAGLALGLALAGVDTEVHAVRVTDEQYANAAAAHRLVRKTADMMRHYGAPLPTGVEETIRLVCRDEFFGEGYGRSTPAAERAVSLAADAARLGLETTYTGKAMAALVADTEAGRGGLPMFWNTYNSQRLDIDDSAPPDFDVVPREFERYFN